MTHQRGRPIGERRAVAHALLRQQGHQLRDRQPLVVQVPQGVALVGALEDQAAQRGGIAQPIDQEAEPAGVAARTDLVRHGGIGQRSTQMRKASLPYSAS